MPRPKLDFNFRLLRPARGQAAFPRVAWKLAMRGGDPALEARWLMALILAGLDVEMGASWVSGIGQETWQKALDALEKALKPGQLPKEPPVRRKKITIRLMPVNPPDRKSA